MLRNTLSRRSVVGGIAVTGLGLALGARRSPSHIAVAQDAPDGPFTLPALPYDYAALEPHIDTLTMQIHHDKHHATYVMNLNKAVVDQPDLQAKSAEELIKSLDAVPEELRAAVRNNAGGHVNHTMFWEIMGAAGAPAGPLADAIARDFDGLPALQEAVNKAGTGRFGSGWAWVVLGADGKLAVTSTTNQDNPLMDGSGTPILGVDVWEHAYYLKYQNKRADYLTAWWNVVNWEAVATRYAAAGGK
ncbi:MAG: superoxide dismutase, Fe-Mn family [Thermomicrobiales bacterium]|nr:superoxide dismutase, Fe-Mn family [Thermomicrobiales bacterium]